MGRQPQLFHVKSQGPLHKMKKPRHRPDLDGVRQAVHSSESDTAKLHSAFAGA